MTKQERLKLRRAIKHLCNNPCEWEDAMALLHELANLPFSDWRKQTGETVCLFELLERNTVVK